MQYMCKFNEWNMDGLELPDLQGWTGGAKWKLIYKLETTCSQTKNNESSCVNLKNYQGVDCWFVVPLILEVQAGQHCGKYAG